MKLYHVELTYTAVVAADSEPEAMDVASESAREVVSDALEPIIRVCHEILDKSDFRDGWDGGCIPYGTGREDRIADIKPELS